MKVKTFTIDFKSINDHRIIDFKKRFCEILKNEINKKKISLGDLQRQIKALGYDYPLIKVIFHDYDDIELCCYPFDLYAILMVLCGVDILLIPYDTKNNSHRYIKKRERIKPYSMNN